MAGLLRADPPLRDERRQYSVQSVRSPDRSYVVRRCCGGRHSPRYELPQAAPRMVRDYAMYDTVCSGLSAQRLVILSMPSG